MPKTAFLLLLLSSELLFSQHKVDSRNIYPRMLAIVPMQGSGTWADPKRPMYAPKPGTVTGRTGILGFTHVRSDDGKLALVEFVAVDRSAFRPILADTSLNVKIFEQGKAKKEDIEAEFGKHKKGFALDQFSGLRIP